MTPEEAKIALERLQAQRIIDAIDTISDSYSFFAEIYSDFDTEKYPFPVDQEKYRIFFKSIYEKINRKDEGS